MDKHTDKKSSDVSVSLIVGTVLFYLSFIPLIYAIYRSFTGYLFGFRGLAWFFGFSAVIVVLFNEGRIIVPFICLLFQIFFFTSYIRKTKKLLKVTLYFIGILIFSILCSSILAETNLDRLERSAQTKIKPHLAALYGEEASNDITYYQISRNGQSYEGHSPVLPSDVSFEIQVVENGEIWDDFTTKFQETNEGFSNDLVQYIIDKHDLPSDMKYKISIVSIDFQDYKNGDDYKVLFERTKYAVTGLDVNYSSITENEAMNIINKVWKDVLPKLPADEHKFTITISVNDQYDTDIDITRNSQNNSATASVHVWSSSSSLYGMNKKQIELTK